MAESSAPSAEAAVTELVAVTEEDRECGWSPDGVHERGCGRDREECIYCDARMPLPRIELPPEPVACAPSPSGEHQRGRGREFNMCVHCGVPMVMAPGEEEQRGPGRYAVAVVVALALVAETRDEAERAGLALVVEALGDRVAGASVRSGGARRTDAEVGAGLV